MLICGQAIQQPTCSVPSDPMPPCGYLVQCAQTSLLLSVDTGGRPLHHNSRATITCQDKDTRQTIQCQVKWMLDQHTITTHPSLSLSVEQVGQAIRAKVTPLERQSYYGDALVKFSPVKLEESLKKLLLNVVEANGSKFPLSEMSHGGRPLGLDRTSILVTSSYVKLTHPKQSVKAKYSDLKYQMETCHDNRSMSVFLRNNRENLQFIEQQDSPEEWLRLDLQLVSTNSRDLVVLSWKAFVLKQYLLDKNIVDNLEHNRVSADNVDLHLQLSRTITHNRTLQRDNEVLAQENARLKKHTPLQSENNAVLVQTQQAQIEKLQAQIEKDKQNQLLLGYLDDRQEVERQMQEMKREVATWVEKDKHNAVEAARWARHKQELVQQVEELKRDRQTQDEFIRNTMKGHNQQNKQAITNYDTAYQLKQLQDKHKEQTQKVRYLSDENSRLKQMASAKSDSTKDQTIRELQQQVAQLKSTSLNTIQQQQIQMLKNQVAQLETQLTIQDQQHQDIYALENEQLQNRNKQLQRKIDSLMQEMCKEKGSENFNMVITNLQIANHKITEENVRLQEELKDCRRQVTSTSQSRRPNRIFGDK